MKKIINKLFEWLGYVHKGKYQDTEVILHNINVMEAEIKLGVCEYQTFEYNDKIFLSLHIATY